MPPPLDENHPFESLTEQEQQCVRFVSGLSGDPKPIDHYLDLIESKPSLWEQMLSDCHRVQRQARDTCAALDELGITDYQARTRVIMEETGYGLLTAGAYLGFC